MPVVRELSSVAIEEALGPLLPLGPETVGSYGYPKLVSLETGRVLRRWPEFSTGDRNSCILNSVDRGPPIGLDPANRRFAIACPERITVITLG